MAVSLQDQRKEQFDQLDQNLDALESISGNINQGAKEIGQELTTQNQMITDINKNMDSTNTNINKATDKIIEVEKTSPASWIAWILMAVFVVLSIVFLIV